MYTLLIIVHVGGRCFPKTGWAALAVRVVSGLDMIHIWGVFSSDFATIWLITISCS
jgi:hypothetical protein